MRQRSASSVLSFCLLAVFCGLSLPTVTAAQPVSVEKAPYLIFAGDNAEMQVMW